MMGESPVKRPANRAPDVVPPTYLVAAVVVGQIQSVRVRFGWRYGACAFVRSIVGFGYVPVRSPADRLETPRLWLPGQRLYVPFASTVRQGRASPLCPLMLY